MNDQTPRRFLVPTAQAHEPQLLIIAAAEAILEHAHDISRATLDRLRGLLGDKFTRLQVAVGAQADALPAQPSSHTDSGARRLHVLVVENRPEVRESWRQLLGLWGHAVTAVKDGPEAIGAASAFAPDVVLMDIGLPTIDGYETARLIRGVVTGSAPTFLALTGRGRDPDVERSRDEGFAGHLHKPVEPSQLQEVLVQIASDEILEPGGARAPAT